MKILVTGSSGYLGEAMMIRFQELGIAALGTDLIAGKYTDQVGDLRHRSFVDQLFTKGIKAVIHAATLHKPHVITHSKLDFIESNMSATLHLLEASVEAGVEAFIFTSTTSTFGDAMRPQRGEPAVWVTEELVPRPKNIYGVTKTAAEDLCQLFYRNHGLPCLVLRTSRFFREVDDNPELRDTYSDPNIKVNELLHRRVDIEDIVQAHLLALEKAGDIGYSKYIITASSPIQQKDLPLLNTDAPAVVAAYYPSFKAIYGQLNWRMFPAIGRVYRNDKAVRELDWKPKYDFGYALQQLAAGQEYRSPLTFQVAEKRYHKQSFDDGPYPV